MCYGKSVNKKDLWKAIKSRKIFTAPCGCTIWPDGRIDGPILYTNEINKDLYGELSRLKKELGVKNIDISYDIRTRKFTYKIRASYDFKIPIKLITSGDIDGLKKYLKKKTKKAIEKLKEVVK